MAEEKKKGDDFSLTGPGVLALALTVIGFVWSGPVPLIAERPPSHMKSDSDGGKIQDVDARMWQDPLAIIQNEIKKSPSAERNVTVLYDGKNKVNVNIHEAGHAATDGHAPKKIFHAAFEKEQIATRNLLQLGVMLPGGPYPEEEEGRRRKRYAVLSALFTLGYAPEETEHIGYFKIAQSEHPDLPDAVPFEFIEKETHSLRDRIVILWLDDSKLDQEMDERVHAIFELAKPDNFDEKKISRSVIGPNKSNILKTALMDGFARFDISAHGINYFAAGATVEHSRLGLGNSSPITPGEKLNIFKPENHLFRTIASDRAISEKLTDELKLRQVSRENGHILLISEWDTYYGRVFPETFTQAFMGKDQAQCMPMTHGEGNPADPSASHVYCINYMRGIDGLLPDEAEKKESEQEAQQKADTIQINNNIDRPSGNYQQDYLRRLADRVRKLDKIILSSKLPCPVKNNGISAIGVVGSDIYDKLMIFQALRPYFPGKIFFTTDLDAAYFSDRELPYTHNLIVGSSFGLSLVPSLQTSIPPFRDSYQTAVFFSTKLAVSNWESEPKNDGDIPAHLAQWLKEPRIFEIGSKGAVDLSPQEDRRNDSVACRHDILLCANIHPAPDIHAPTHHSPSTDALYGVSLLLGLLLLYRMNWAVREYTGKAKTRLLDWLHCPSSCRKAIEQNEMFSMLLFLLASVIIIWIGYVIVSSNDEPVYAWSGVSIWPSNLLQLLALLISLMAYVTLKKRLADTDKKLGEAFLNIPGGIADSAKFKLTSSQCIWSVHKWEACVTGGNRVDIAKLWERYCEYGQPRYRFWRAAIGTFFFVLFGIAAVMLTGGQPVPSRGHGSFLFDVALESLCVLAAVFLIMWVVDAARLTSQLIRLIATEKPSAWPSIGKQEWGWPQQCDAHALYWLDIEFVARYTKAMENFIWYPLPPLLLLGAARSPIFDNWTFSPGLLAAILILLVYLFSVAFILQRVAKKMREKAVAELNEHLRRLRSLSQETELLEKMIAEIKGNEEGAFTPFLRQPLVQALLAFMSGSGGLFILMGRFF